MVCGAGRFVRPRLVLEEAEPRTAVGRRWFASHRHAVEVFIRAPRRLVLGSSMGRLVRQRAGGLGVGTAPSAALLRALHDGLACLGARPVLLMVACSSGAGARPLPPGWCGAGAVEAVDLCRKASSISWAVPGHKHAHSSRGPRRAACRRAACRGAACRGRACSWPSRDETR